MPQGEGMSVGKGDLRNLEIRLGLSHKRKALTEVLGLIIEFEFQSLKSCNLLVLLLNSNYILF